MANQEDLKIQELQIRAEKAEAEIPALLERIQKLTSGLTLAAPETGSEEEKLFLDNSKLKYRLNILQRAVENATMSPVTNNVNKDGMLNIQNELEDLFRAAVEKAYPELPDYPPVVVVPTAQPKFGDYQYNGAMEICKILKGISGGKGPVPRDVAGAIKAALAEHPLIAKTELAGGFFVNITLNAKFLSEQLVVLVTKGVRAPLGIRKQRVVIDFSSPNIAKEMHVGHLRSTIIGDSLAKLLEFMGHDVLRINHVGDWGTQFGMLLAHLEDCFPHFATETPPIGDLQGFYKESKLRFDSDEEFKARAYSCVVKLQSKDPVYIRGWQAICDVSRREFQKIYDRLEISLIERGESFYQERMVDVVKLLQAAGHLEQDDGRKVMFAPGLKVPLTVVKSDGGFTYDTSDMATIRQRIDEEKCDWIIYVTDLGQAGHFEIIFGCAERTGWLQRSKTRVDHVGFGVVLGEDRKKFKSRSSDTVRLVDLLDEGLRRALEKIMEREEAKKKEGKDTLNEEEIRDAQHSIAYGCIKYADLSHNRNAEYVFSFDKMLEDKGNTAVYLLYAYTRIRSIARTANITSEQLRSWASEKGMSIEHEKELKLSKALLRFPEIICRVSNELALHPLCEYLYEISTTFTEFYQVCYCVEKDRQTDEIVKVNMDRLALCEATALVMAQCFALLGLKPVQKM